MVWMVVVLYVVVKKDVLMKWFCLIVKLNNDVTNMTSSIIALWYIYISFMKCLNVWFMFVLKNWSNSELFLFYLLWSEKLILFTCFLEFVNLNNSPTVGRVGFYAQLKCRILFLSPELMFQTHMWSNSGSHFDGFATIVSHHHMHLQMLESRLFGPPNNAEYSQMILM